MRIFSEREGIPFRDGTTRAIKDLDEGDFVWATDPETGSTRAREVTDVRSNKSWKHLITVTVDVDGKKGGTTSTLTSTAGHPYWLPAAGHWKTTQPTPSP